MPQAKQEVREVLHAARRGDFAAPTPESEALQPPDIDPITLASIATAPAVSRIAGRASQMARKAVGAGFGNFGRAAAKLPTPPGFPKGLDEKVISKEVEALWTAARRYNPNITNQELQDIATAHWRTAQQSAEAAFDTYQSALQQHAKAVNDILAVPGYKKSVSGKLRKVADKVQDMLSEFRQFRTLALGEDVRQPELKTISTAAATAKEAFPGVSKRGAAR